MTALLVLAAGAVMGAPAQLRSPSALARLVYNMSSIHTMDPAIPSADAFCVEDGKFSAIGTLAEAAAACPASAEHLDLRGAHVIPGLIDSHFHLLYGGFKLLRPSLDDCTSANSSNQSVVAVLRAFVRARPLAPGGWLLGFGWDQNQWTDKGFPTRQELDAEFPTDPVWLTRIDGHAAWANSAALRAVPALPSTNPEGGTIQRDPKTGDPTGVFTDNAMALVENHIPPPSPQDNNDALTLVLKDAAANGLTGIHNPGITPDQIDLFKGYIDAGTMTLRQYAMYLGVAGGLGKAATPSSPKIDPEYGGRLAVKAVKFFMDGALGSWGAAMIQNYTDRPDQHGQLRMTEAEYDRNVSEWAAAGFQIATHAIGDLANRIVLDKYRRICEDRGVPDLRNRIEHFQIVNVTDIPKLKVGTGPHAGTCILPSMQPTHATSDMVFAETRLGPDRLKGAYAWQTAVETGIGALPLGSDFPTVGVVPPLLGIYAAVTRQDINGLPAGGWTPEEKLSARQALKGYTADAAFASFQEDTRGAIKPGMLADFVALDRDILDPATAPTIWKAVVLGTYLGGDPTFQHACYDAAATAMCPQDNAAAILAKLRLKRTGDHGCPH